jgi:hypothetical protein
MVAVIRYMDAKREGNSRSTVEHVCTGCTWRRPVRYDGPDKSELVTPYPWRTSGSGPVGPTASSEVYQIYRDATGGVSLLHGAKSSPTPVGMCPGQPHEPSNTWLEGKAAISVSG